MVWGTPTLILAVTLAAADLEAEVHDPAPDVHDGATTPDPDGTADPDDGATTPDPDDGATTPNSDDGATTPDPDDGATTPDPDDGATTPDPDDGATTPDPGDDNEPHETTQHKPDDLQSSVRRSASVFCNDPSGHPTIYNMQTGSRLYHSRSGILRTGGVM